ncbi:MAG TPA: hypothetical protein DDW65_02775 [Firmicutes bacterium]|jgi:hypothetical protein|nr:hypothetical protein [Bacillota bacterium]
MFTTKPLTGRERFLQAMEYKAVDRVPNWEAGVWEQTIDRWEKEGLDRYSLHWDWFTGEEKFGMDVREFIDVNYGMKPEFAREVLEKDDRYEIIRNSNGVVSKALIEGTSGNMRACMDQYLRFPVSDLNDFRELKKRYLTKLGSRYPAQWREIMLPRWKNREHVLILGRNCSTGGFYWRAREWMGTENLCYALYDQPELLHEMMEFIGNFTIEVSRPVLEHTDIDYVMISEDMSMKNGPLLSPEQYRTFIFPHMQKLVDYFKKNGVRYVAVDTDGNCELLIPLLLEAGVDAIWPLERAAGMDPVKIRRKFGKELRLWGGVDKMELAKGKEAIDTHLASLVPLIEEGGFIPTVDHLVPPDVSLADFQYYMQRKLDLLQGRF